MSGRVSLRDLDPRWVSVGNWTMGAFHKAGTKFHEAPTPFYIGVNFLCPSALHHHLLHRDGVETFQQEFNVDLEAEAAACQAAWLSFSGGSPK